MHKFITSALFVGLFAAIGCSGTNVGNNKDDLDGKGAVAMALTNSAGDCVSALVRLHEITPNSSISDVDVVTTCSDTRQAIETILMPGRYTVSVLDDPATTGVEPICDPIDEDTTPPPPPSGSSYDSCSFNPLPVLENGGGNFVVTEGATTTVTLTFTFHYTGQEDEIAVFGVGSAELLLNQPVLEELCGDGPHCSSPQICASVSAATQTRTGCFTPCTVGGSQCATGQTCMPVAALSANDIGGHSAPNPNPNPAPVLVGSENDLDSILHVCVPLTPVSGPN